MHDQTVAGAAEVGGDLLGPLKGVFTAQAQPTGTCRLGFRVPDLIELGLKTRQPQLDAVETGYLIHGPFQAAFGRGAVVTDDIEDEGIVQFPGFLDGGNERLTCSSV